MDTDYFNKCDLKIDYFDYVLDLLHRLLEASSQVCGDQWSLTMNTTQAGQSGVVGTRSAPPGLTEDIRSPQKGPFGAQTNPFCLFSRAGWFHMG